MGGMITRVTRNRNSVSNKFMRVGVELECDLFRNAGFCLCGCLSTFTSYKKHMQEVSKEGGDGTFTFKLPAWNRAGEY